MWPEKMEKFSAVRLLNAWLLMDAVGRVFVVFDDVLTKNIAADSLDAARIAFEGGAK